MIDQRFKAGNFVVSRVPAWGIGKVLEILEEDKVRVFFEYEGEKLMLPDFLDSTLAPVLHPVLEKIDPLRTTEGFIPFHKLETSFLNRYPLGFDDQKYFKDERDYKINASGLLHESMSKEILSRLIDQGDYASVYDLTKKMIGKNNLIFRNEKISLFESLKKGVAEQKLFSNALYELLYGDAEIALRFDAFADVLEKLDTCKWPIATYFTFLLDPSCHICVKPTYFQAAARSYAFEINYVARPRWACYRRILKFVDHVGKQLSKRSSLKPHDLIDVQGFIWCSLH
jgi:hypothetical protein